MSLDIRSILAMLIPAWVVLVVGGLVLLAAGTKKSRGPLRFWVACVAILSAITFIYTRPGLRIVSPLDGATVRYGETVPFRVEPSFGRGFEFVTLKGEPSLGFVLVKKGPPPFIVPVEFYHPMPPGDYRICAVGRNVYNGLDQGRSLCITVHLVDTAKPL